MFRLLRHFSLTSAIAFLVVTLVVAGLFRQIAVNVLVELAERQNMVLARSFANALWPRFSSYVTGASGLDGDVLRARPETRQIHQALEKLTAGLPVLEVTIYDAGGLTVYSSRPDQIGATKADVAGFLVAARDGRPLSKLTFRETVPTFRGIVEDCNLVESYLPIRFADGPVEGVFELHSDVTTLMANIEESTFRFFSGLVLAFAALYGVLFLIVRRANRILNRQYAELEHENADRKRTEISLRRFVSIFESSADAITAMTPGGIITDWNPAAEDMYGFTTEEAIGQNISIIIPPGRRDEILNLREEAIRGQQFKRVATVRIRKDGTPLEISLSVAPVVGTAGDIIGVTAIHRDITELIRADEVLRENALTLQAQYARLEEAHEERIRVNQRLAREIAVRERAEMALKRAHDEMEDQIVERTTQLSAVLANAVTGIVTMDFRGIIRSFNPAAEKMFGYAAAEVVSRNVSMLMPERDAAEHGGHLTRYLSGKQSVVLGRVRQIIGRRRDGSTFPMDLSVGKMVVGGEVSFVGNLTDIGEHLEREDQLRHAQKMESLGQLTGGVAHEFNNLLTAIGGFAEMGQRKADDIERVREYFAEIVKASDQAAGLTRQMLTLSRTQVIERRLTPVGETITALEPMLKPLVGAGIDLRLELCDPEIHAIIDSDQLSQAILNLAINGCHAMPDGGELAIGCGAVTPPGRFMALHPEIPDQRCIAAYVVDQGSGIPDDVLPGIFDPFFTTKETGKGTGLGLSMVYGMAEQSGGFVDVETEIGKGTRFTIYLPLAEADKDGRAEGAAAVGGWTGTVLIVEPKAGVRELARETLTALGHTVLTARSGAEAEDLLRSRSSTVDLLITDFAISGPTGPELARRLMAGNPDLRVIFLSVDTGRDAGAGADLSDQNEFLQKPIDRRELVRLVGELFEGVTHHPFR